MTQAELPFATRRAAGKALAAKLLSYAGRADLLVLALPRGGVPVGYEVAKELKAPLDVLIVRKLGCPGQKELAFGALANGVRIVNQEIAKDIPESEIEAITRQELRELERRALLYRENRPALITRDRTVLLVDDGLATGSTMRAAVAALRRSDPAKIVLCVPVGSMQACAEFQSEVDEVVCAIAAQSFQAVSLWYEDFSQTSDEEVRELLRKAAARESYSATIQ